MKKDNEKDPQVDVTSDFVQDKFFGRGNFLLKLRQTLVTLVFWVMIILPLLTLINSVSEYQIWKNVYRWDWTDGVPLARDLSIMIVLSLLVFIFIGGLFLMRNNHNLKKVYPEKKTYDVERAAARCALLEAAYTERFGSREFRENIDYYSVIPEKNMDTGFAHQLFNSGGYPYE
ncbi:hypothetical protein [Lactococcus garvieae]|uniref:hypothetical protein n=1 Tax=Lactococcus garvieae TaxID=1363 RepID=UPI0018D77DF4|nr:hypothetical protein [Lactococcus garvieae]QPS71502.1 hypothetical protein I6G50_02235 [Lactococcus garvieae]